MSERRIVVLECDMCGTEDLVETHSMVVDGATVEFEACDRDWSKTLENFAAIAKFGRKPAPLKRVSKKSETYDFPGESWRFTAHALQRLGERKISPHDACMAADKPEVTRGAREPQLQVRERRGVKVVVNEKTRTIITASNEEEEAEDVA